ncbi:MAG: ATP-binding protein [Treponema sp.]|nr:ATP-binding protein [Treponema sp.]
MILLKRNKLVLSLSALGFSLLLAAIFLFIKTPVIQVTFLFFFLIAVAAAVHKYCDLLSAGLKNQEREVREIADEMNEHIKNAQSESSRLQVILNAMPEAVFAADNDLKLHLANPKARELFGLENLKNDITLLEATRSTELVETAKKAIKANASLETELTFHKGEEQRFQVFASPLGNNTGVVIVLLNITRLAKLERIRKDFIANVSHELRTPIQLIKGFSETLLDSVKDKQNLHFVDIIRKNTTTMENLTNDLLMLAELENTGINTRSMEEIKIASIVNDSVSSLEPQAKKKLIEINVKCGEELTATLYGSLMILALINLIDNGIKYSPPKSKLWVSAFIENDELIFEVKDKGAGIPAEHLEKIFERFYRVDRARSRTIQTEYARGTGLGLAIVRHIALLHNGKAEAESYAGEGSVFRITIPVSSR